MTKEELMHRAIELSKNSVKTGGGPFGAVIAKDGIIIAEASNSVTIDLDPTAHAEVNCIRQATRKLKTFNLEGCEIYTSCEPCPMCLCHPELYAGPGGLGIRGWKRDPGDGGRGALPRGPARPGLQ